MVDRTGIKNGFYQRLAEEGARCGLIQPLSDEERRRSREETVANRPPGAGLWVFAYGSLLWNPAFHYAESCQAKLYGYHRSFCLKSPIGRGTAERPALILGLDRGGSVQGMAYRVEEDKAEEELDLLWSREMLAGSYRPTWVNLKSPRGERFQAIAFVMRRDCPRYAGGLSIEETARLIADAHGPLGPCMEYLENTVNALDALGFMDGPMHDLRARVRELSSTPPG